MKNTLLFLLMSAFLLWRYRKMTTTNLLTRYRELAAYPGCLDGGADMPESREKQEIECELLRRYKFGDESAAFSL